MRGTIYTTEGHHKQNTTWTILDVLYDPSLPVKENKDIIRSLGYKIGQTVLYAYLKERSFRKVGKRTDDEIKELIDPTKTIIYNHTMIHSLNIQCSKNRVMTLLQQVRREKNINNVEV